MMNLICLMNHILFQTFKIVLSTLLKKQETIANNPPVQIYGNKVFKIKTGYKLELLSPKTTKLLGSTGKNKDDQDKDGEDVAKLESFDVALVHWNLVNNIYKQAYKHYLILYQINNLVN